MCDFSSVPGTAAINSDDAKAQGSWNLETFETMNESKRTTDDNESSYHQTHLRASHYLNTGSRLKNIFNNYSLTL